MTGRTAPASSAALKSAWWHGAVLKTVGGFAVGVLVIIAVIATMAAIPELKQAGIDAGIALSSRLQLATSVKLGLREAEMAAGVEGYVFVDLDAGRVLAKQPGVSAGEVACRQLLAEDRTANADCFDPALTDRVLLARVLRQVVAAGARAVVLDIELGASHPKGRSGDDARLREALGAAGPVPVFFVIPTEAVAPPQPNATPRLLSGAADFFSSTNVRGLPTEMALGTVARSFPHCYLIRRSPSVEEPLPAIPRAVAAAVQGKPVACPDAADVRASRIVYTLPSSDVDADRKTVAANDPAALALQIKLNRVYNRCLAASLWSSESACSEPAYFEGRVVVIGSSASYRGDWHYTPLGDMPGPLILVNAIRSEILFGEAQGKSLLGSFAFKLLVLLACTGVWLMYWLQNHYRSQQPKHDRPKTAKPVMAAEAAGAGEPPSAAAPAPNMPNPAIPAKAGRWRSSFLDVIALLATVGGVMWISYAMSYSPTGADHSLDVLLPGLTVGIEVFVEIVSTLVGKLEKGVARALDWEPTH